MTETASEHPRLTPRAPLTLVASGPQRLPAPLASRRADIQGLRALAVLFVVLYHTGGVLPGGFTGVDIFFVISGYVIAGSLVGELDQSGRISLPGFYGRRAKRLLPGLAVMLACVVPLATLLGPAASLHTESITGVFASVFAANVYLASLPTGYFDSGATLNPLLHTWTLAVEEQFYLVFPLLLIAGARFKRRATATALVASATVASFAYATTQSGKTAFYGAPARAWEFGVGALLLLLTPLFTRVTTTTARMAGLIGLGSLAGAVLAPDHASFLGSTAVVPVVGAGGLLLAGTVTQTGATRLLSARMLGWIGDRSYGWYLWHWPLIVFATALWPGAGWAPPVAAAASLLPTWLSFRFVENPIRFHAAMNHRRALALGIACTAVSLTACGAALAIGHGLDDTRSISSWRTSQTLHADFRNGCENSTPLPDRPAGKCTWTVPHARGTIVLFGDSNAGHFTEPVVLAGNRIGYDVEVVTSSGCPYVALGPSPYCRRFARSSLDAIVSSRPNLVVLAGRTDLYLDGLVITDRNGPIPTSRTLQVDSGQWQRALTTMLRRLNRADVPVLLVHPVPLLGLSAPSCAVLRVLTGACSASISRASAERELRTSVEVENAAVAGTSESSAIGLNDHICTRTVCSNVRRGVVMYLNRDHLSVRGALTLTPVFERAIRLHARAGNVPQKGAVNHFRHLPISVS